MINTMFGREITKRRKGVVRGRIRFWVLFPKKCFAQRNAIEKVAFE